MHRISPVMFKAEQDNPGAGWTIVRFYATAEALLRMNYPPHLPGPFNKPLHMVRQEVAFSVDFI